MPLGMKVAALLSLLLLAACKDPKVANDEGDAASTAASATAAPSATAVASATTVAGCKSDGDCTTHASYCAEAPCACQAMMNTEDTRACTGGRVSCFADPCMRKAAACQNGSCVLVTKN